ncbi:MAG: hypothetical protein WC533_04295 [Candidatus Pacearchaeota archaeon]
MKSKKASWLIGNAVITLIVAALCIALLIGLSMKLYDMNKKNEEKKQAKAQFDEIMNKVNSLEEGQSLSHILLYPKSWMVIGWPYEDVKPNKCSNWENCLCLCYFSASGGGYFDGIDNAERVYKTYKLSSVEEVAAGCEVLGFCGEVKHREVVVSSSLSLSVAGNIIATIFSIGDVANPIESDNSDSFNELFKKLSKLTSLDKYKSPIFIDGHLLDNKAELQISLEDDVLWIVPKNQ